MADIPNDMLDVESSALVDESIESLNFVERESQNPNSINSASDISIEFLAGDEFTLPARSYLWVEGRLSSGANDADYTDQSLVALVHNAVPFMFSRLRYQINGKDVENINNPGVASTMKGMLTYGDDFAKGEGLNMCWQKDTTTTAASANLGWEARRQMIMVKPKTAGTFSFGVPLKHLFGFAEDYRRVLYGVKQTLQLTRKSDKEAIFRDAAAPDGKITLTKLAWMMPIVNPALEFKDKFLKMVERKAKLDVAFRAMQCDTVEVPAKTTWSWPLSVTTGTSTPRWILVGFQTARTDSQTTNPALFDHVQVKQIQAEINASKYPEFDVDADFTQLKTSRLYKMMLDFKHEYYGITDGESSNSITPLEFVDHYPIFVFDCRRQSERLLKDTSKNVRIVAKFGANVPADTRAYAVVICDRILKLESDGSKFSRLTEE